MSITHILKFGILLKQGYNDVSHKDTRNQNTCQEAEVVEEGNIFSKNI
jgi:hypothetical protein